MKDADGFEIVLSKNKIQQSAAPENIFEVDEAATKFSKECDQYFHHIVANSPYISKRARPDLCVAISFLTTRV